jgi:four helix bundle protein
VVGGRWSVVGTADKGHNREENDDSAATGTRMLGDLFLGAAMSSKSVIRSYQDLRVWQQGMELMVLAYKVARRLPKEETYGLANQIRRAAVSIPSNVAEGHGREHLGDYLRHLSIANGSLKELETEILATERLGYVKEPDIARALEVAADVGRMLAGLKGSLGKRFWGRNSRSSDSPSRITDRRPTPDHRPPTT